MKTTWFVVESDENKILIVEIVPHRSDGLLKLFQLDGEGYLWMPYSNPPPEFTNPRTPERFGRLLAASQGPPPVSLLKELVRGREAVIIPVS